MKKKTKGIGIYVVIFALLLLIASMMFNMNEPVSTYRYSDIISYFQEGQVEEYELDLGSGVLEFKLRGQDQVQTYKVPYVTKFIDQIEDDVQAYNAEHPDDPIVYDWAPVPETPWWVSLVPSILLIGAMLAFWYYMMRQSKGGGQMMGFGKAKVRTQDGGRKVTFADVAGADEEKEELVEIVQFLKSPGKFNALGARIPKGVLLMGPPGTGKTLLARAVAGEAGVPFYSISGSDFVEMFVGVGASRVRDLFEQAKKNAPSIVFIDEIDAVGRQRGAGLGGGHDEREQTLNQMLVEMDGFSTNSGVIVMAATNRRDILDPALLRPGRFDRQIMVGYPDVRGREEILKVHTRNKPIGPDVDLKIIARTTAGFTGADLENLTNEAALAAAKANRKAITMKDIEEATIKVMAGPEKKSHVVTDKEKNLTAYHEAGHAICTYHCSTQEPVHQVSIIPRGQAGGYTMSLPGENINYRTKREMEENIVVLLGGRMAELLILGDISTGASNDLERATKMARAMVTRYGFSDAVGPIVYGQDPHEVFLGRDFSSGTQVSEKVTAEIDEEVRRIIETAYERARTILSEHADQLHRVAEYLKVHEKINRDTFERLVENRLEEEAEAPQSPAQQAQEQAAGDEAQAFAPAQAEPEKPDCQPEPQIPDQPQE